MKKAAVMVVLAALGVAMGGCVSYEHIERDRARHNREVDNPPPPRQKLRPFVKRVEPQRESPAQNRPDAPQPPRRDNR